MRSDDITEDPRYGHNAPYHGMPEGHLPGAQLPRGAGDHRRPAARCSAGSSSATREPARVHRAARAPGRGHRRLGGHRAGQRPALRARANFTRELLAQHAARVPAVPGLGRRDPLPAGGHRAQDRRRLVRRHPPRRRAAPRSSSATSSGTGSPAATIDGPGPHRDPRVRRARPAPSDVLRHVSPLLDDLREPTSSPASTRCSPADEALIYANAGHLPAVLRRADGTDRAARRGHGPAARRRPRVLRAQRGVPARADLLLYTDGLVESRTRDLTQGIEWCSRRSPRCHDRSPPRPATAWSRASPAASTTTTSRSSTSTARRSVGDGAHAAGA